MSNVQFDFALNTNFVMIFARILWKRKMKEKC